MFSHKEEKDPLCIEYSSVLMWLGEVYHKWEARKPGSYRGHIKDVRGIPGKYMCVDFNSDV